MQRLVESTRYVHYLPVEYLNLAFETFDLKISRHKKYALFLECFQLARLSMRRYEQYDPKYLLDTLCSWATKPCIISRTRTNARCIPEHHLLFHFPCKKWAPDDMESAPVTFGRWEMSSKKKQVVVECGYGILQLCSTLDWRASHVKKSRNSHEIGWMRWLSLIAHMDVSHVCRAPKHGWY